MNSFQNLVEMKLDPVGKSGNDVIYRCPKCEGISGSGHLYVNYDRNVYHCFKCNFRGRNIVSLLKFLNVDIDFDYGRLYSDRERELSALLEKEKKKSPLIEIVDYSTNLLSLTEYYQLHTKELSSEALNYLIRRGLSEDLIYRLKIREGVNNYGKNFILSNSEYVGRDYSTRIMIPSLRKDNLVSFYVGRDYTGLATPKYLNPPKSLAIASEDVWGLDIVESDSVVICEGVMTAIAVNQALEKFIAVATYGKSIAQRSSSESGVLVTSQGEKLLSRKFKQYILFYDKDALQDSIKTAEYLYDRGANVKVVIIETEKYGPKADAADMSKEEIIYHILNAQEFNKFIGIL